MEFSVGRERRRPIPGFGGKYEVSDLGNVYSNGCALQKVKGKYVSLSGPEGVMQVKVCYLVARAFLSNMELRPYVVHLDGDLENNRADNLSWSETEEARRGRKPSGRRVWVHRRDTGEFVGQWDSLSGACRALGVDCGSARRVADGERKSVGGYVFRWWA